MIVENRGKRQTEIAQCPVHTSIKEKCIELLKRDAFFDKDRVLVDLHYGNMAASVRWDYIRTFIAEEYKIQLMPIVSRFFNQSAKKYRKRVTIVKNGKSKKMLEPVTTPAMNPGAFLARGNGKKTAGYASVDERNGTLVLRHLEHKRSTANGFIAKTEQFAEKAKPVLLAVEQQRLLEAS